MPVISFIGHKASKCMEFWNNNVGNCKPGNDAIHTPWWWPCHPASHSGWLMHTWASKSSSTPCWENVKCLKNYSSGEVSIWCNLLEIPIDVCLIPCCFFRYNIMKLCWGSESYRPSMTHIHSLLMHLWDNLSVVPHDTALMHDFELRWNQLQQQRPQDHSIVHAGNATDLR